VVLYPEQKVTTLGFDVLYSQQKLFLNCYELK